MPDEPIDLEIVPASQQSYLAALRSSGLLEGDRITALLREWDRVAGSQQTDGPALAKHFQQAGVTSWQNKMLLEGRYKGFFVANYVLLAHLGGGAMSNVYLARAPDDSQVAIKLLSHKLGDSSAPQRFYYEARATLAMRHPNIIRAIDSGEFDGTMYLVMEYVQGRDLHQIVADDGPLDFVKIADYIRQTADGLHYGHERGVIHRDIKPSNLLVDERDTANPFGTVKILDLGLARFPYEDSSRTIDREDKLLGTPNYMAPEQMLDCHEVDARADIYALGCTFYHLLTGHAPFHEGPIAKRLVKHQSEAPASIRFERPDTPEPLVVICRRMLAKHPDGRYATAEEVSRELSDWLGTQSTMPQTQARKRAAGQADKGRTDRPEDFDNLVRWSQGKQPKK